MKRLHYLPFILVPLVLTGCLSFLGPIDKEHRILGWSLSDTVLILDENYTDDSTFIPAGVYLPDSTFSRGVANYLGNKPISVKLAGLIRRQCTGGISTDFDAPFREYRVFLYDCGGERVITYSIPKKLKFRIINKSELQLKNLK